VIHTFYRDLQALNVRCQVVKDVKFSLKGKKRSKNTGLRNVLFVSTYKTSPQTLKKVTPIFHSHQAQYISFPIKERSKHLLIRFQENIFNFGYFPVPWFSKFRILASRLPQRATLETIVPLQPSETLKMSSYIENIKASKRRTLGGFNNDGFQYTKGNLNDNRTQKKGHNCTSWLATAPIGPKNEALLELLGTTREYNIGTNPGWWSAWNLSRAKRDIQAIYWDVISLDKMLNSRLDHEQFFKWDFKRL